jgi:hypothetical protein
MTKASLTLMQAMVSTPAACSSAAAWTVFPDRGVAYTHAIACSADCLKASSFQAGKQAGVEPGVP